MYIGLLFPCQIYLIWPPVLPLNLTYILIFLRPTTLSELALYRLLTFHVTNLIPIFFSLRRLSTAAFQVGGLLWYSVTGFLLHWGAVSFTANHQVGGPYLFGCPRLLIQYIPSYSPYLEAVSSIRNLRTRHALVTRDPPNIDSYIYTYI
jgi:hypothetical protein